MNRHLLICLLLGLLCGALLIALPSGLLLMPALFGAAGAVYGIRCMSAGLCMGSISCAVAAITAAPDPIGLISAVLSFLPGSMILFFSLALRKPYRTAAALCAVAAGIALYCGNCLPALMEGKPPFAHFEEYTKLVSDEIVRIAGSEPAYAAMKEQIEYIAAATVARATSAAALSMTGIAMAAGLFNVLIARAICKKRGADIKPMAPFYSWQLARSFVNGSLILLVGALLISSSSLSSAPEIVAVLHFVVLGPYALMGACLMAYAKKRRVRGNLFFVISILMLALLIPYSIYGLGFMGAFDRIFRTRRHPPA